MIPKNASALAGTNRLVKDRSRKWGSIQERSFTKLTAVVSCHWLSSTGSAVSLSISLGQCSTLTQDIFPQIVPPDNFSLHLGYFSPAVKTKIWKLTLTHTPDPNRSTSINFVHVNGRSLYIVDWRMVVIEGGNVLHHVKREGELPGRNVSGGNVRLSRCLLLRCCCCATLTLRYTASLLQCGLTHVSCDRVAA